MQSDGLGMNGGHRERERPQGQRPPRTRDRSTTVTSTSTSSTVRQGYPSSSSTYAVSEVSPSANTTLDFANIDMRELRFSVFPIITNASLADILLS